jgi:serine/threonine-protein kinase
MSTVPARGERFGGSYEVVREIGRGSAGIVVEAKHLVTGERFAVKFLRSDEALPTELIARFRREGRAMARLTSRHAVRVVEVGTAEDGMPFLVMELLQGRTLHQEVLFRGQLPVAEAVDIVLQACVVMTEAHARGIVHRDLKPANIYLCAADTGGAGIRLVKVMDFGVAKMVEASEHTEHHDLTRSGVVVGTPAYVAPEQALSSKRSDHRADIWALGVVLYRLLSGKLPFDHATTAGLLASIAHDEPVPFSSVAPDVSPALGAIIMDALRREPSERLGDIATFAKRLSPFGSGGFSYDNAVSKLDLKPAPKPRDRRLFILIGVVAVLSLVTIAAIVVALC